MSNYTGLSAAECEALEDEDLDNAPADPEGLADEGEDEGKGEEHSAEGQNDAGEDAADKSDEGQPSQAEGSQSFSVPSADIGQIDQALKDLNAQREALESAYEAGDSDKTYAEHRAELREVDQAIQELNLEKAEARAIQKLNAAYQLEWWTREVNAFKREAMKEGIDYDKDEKLGAEWDRAVQFLGQDPNNANQEAKWFLQEAHEMVKARFRVGTTRSEPANPASRVDEALAARRRRKNELPPSLAKVPEAGQQDEREAEFSHLEKLSGEALEKALARMSPDQADRYLSS